jgi:hypothetical protein
VYCPGDFIEDFTGMTSDELWLTSRWLRVAKQPGGWRSAMARTLSGENPQPQFISDVFITPESPYAADSLDGITPHDRTARRTLVEPPLCAGSCCRLARSAASQIRVFCVGFSRAGQQQGNLPQALTRMALISAAFNLDRALRA